MNKNSEILIYSTKEIVDKYEFEMHNGYRLLMDLDGFCTDSILEVTGKAKVTVEIINDV